MKVIKQCLGASQTLTGSQMCLSYWFRLPLCGLKPCSSIAHKAIPAELIDHLPVAEFSDPDDCTFRLFFHPERCFSLLSSATHLSQTDSFLTFQLAIRISYQCSPVCSGCHKNAFFTVGPLPLQTVLTGVFKGNYDSL